MFAAHQTTGDKTRKTPQKKKRKKPAKTRKSWNIVVLGSFRIFLVVPKFITVCVPGRSAEIFPETYMFGTKWIIFWFVWPIFLERPFFPWQWRVEVPFPSFPFLSLPFPSFFLPFSFLSHPFPSFPFLSLPFPSFPFLSLPFPCTHAVRTPPFKPARSPTRLNN